MLNTLSWEEFQIECKMNYFKLVEYLNTKYGVVTYDYTSNKRDSLRGLFLHHIMEWRYANLSSEGGIETFPEYQTAQYLVYCNWLEHLLLHAKIFREYDSPRKWQEDNGALDFMIPQIYSYLEMNIKICKYGKSYYDNISNKDALKIFKCIVSMFNLEYNYRTLLNIVKNAEKDAELDGYEVKGYKRIIANTFWSNTEISILKDNIQHGFQYVKEKLIENNGEDIRSMKAIISKAYNYGYRSIDPRTWSEAELNILKEYYPIYGSKYVYNKILETCNRERALPSISSQARKHGLSYIDNIKYSNKELNIIKKYYPIYGSKYVQEMLMKKCNKERAIESIFTKAHSMNIYYDDPKSWTEKEINILKKHYSICRSVKDLLPLLPNRTELAIRHMASCIGIKLNLQWTEKELNILKEFYPYNGMKKTLELLPNRTEKAIEIKCVKLGIKRIK